MAGRKKAFFNEREISRYIYIYIYISIANAIALTHQAPVASIEIAKSFPMRSLLSIAVAATLHLLAVRAADKPQLPKSPLNFTKTAPGKPIKPGTELRILPVGDSLTYGFLSDEDGGDGNGYRLRLRDDLSSKTNIVVCGRWLFVFANALGALP